MGQRQQSDPWYFKNVAKSNSKHQYGYEKRNFSLNHVSTKSENVSTVYGYLCIEM